MDEPEEFHATLIRALGGKAKLARALGLERELLSKWHERGIPSRYWHRVVELAQGSGIAISAADLERTKPGAATTVPRAGVGAEAAA